MRLIARHVVLLFLLVITTSLVASAQLPSSSPTKTPGTVAGRVMVGSQPAEGVEILIRQTTSNPLDFLQFTPTTTTTDADGRYRLMNIAPGNYRLSVHAPAYVMKRRTDNSLFPPGEGISVNIGEGETVENPDISLSLGGVVSGKVTDPDGRPVIGESIIVKNVQSDGKDVSLAFNHNIRQTDDRGIYRVFGLEPGRYLIGAGGPSGVTGTVYYLQTFYPGVVDEKDASHLEIRSGVVLENVDIKLLAKTSVEKTFSAKGRVIEVDSGKGVAGLIITYSGSTQGGLGNSATNSLGEFRLEGLKPGTYRASPIGLEASENYGEPIEFEITNHSLEGLEIKMLKGVSISGVAVIEGSNDPQLREKMTRLVLFALSEPINSQGMAPISQNGVFRITGIRPGKIHVVPNTIMVPGIAFVRMEHNGVEVREFQLGAGENVTGVRLVFAPANGSISGRIEVRDGTLPPNAPLMVDATREGSSVSFSEVFGRMVANVDPRGRFLFEGLSPGTYRLRVFPQDPSGGAANFPRTEQTVVVADNTRQEVTIVVDLSKRGQK